VTVSGNTFLWLTDVYSSVYLDCSDVLNKHLFLPVLLNTENNRKRLGCFQFVFSVFGLFSFTG